MKKSARLQVIIDLHIQQENNALQILGENQQKQHMLEQQLQNLQSYRHDYKKKYREMNRHKVTVHQLMEFNAFISKLDNAILSQQKTVEAAQIELSQNRKIWEEKHQKTLNLQKISEKAVVEELKQTYKREQAEQDDRACRSGKINGTRNA